MLVALARAAVLAENEECEKFSCAFYFGAFMSIIAGKKLNKDKLAGRLEEAAGIMKSVFRFVFPLIAVGILLTAC